VPTIGWRLAEALGEAANEWVNGAREQKRADGVTLLHTGSIGELAIAEDEVRVVTVKPLGPARQLWEVGS
jgi:hypothetical protein